MKHFLASQAKHPQTLKDIENFVGGFNNKKIGYIPTAANGEEGYGKWQDGGSWKAVRSLNAQITPLVLEEMNSSDVKITLESQDIIWVGGGYWGYLMYWLRRHSIQVYLPNLLQSGKVYIGSSAGANILSKSLDIAKWFISSLDDIKNNDVGETGGSIFPGLGLIDFDIYPHYQEALLPHIKNHYRGKKMYLLKDGEAITVENNKITVLGEERIIL